MYKKPIIKPKIPYNTKLILEWFENKNEPITLKSCEDYKWSHKYNHPIYYGKKDFSKVQRNIGASSSWKMDPQNPLRYRDPVVRHTEYSESRNLFVILSQVTNKLDKQYGKYYVKVIQKNKATSIKYGTNIFEMRKLYDRSIVPLHLKHVAGVKNDIRIKMIPNRNYDNTRINKERGLYYIEVDGSFYDFDNFSDAYLYYEFLKQHLK